MYLVCSALSIVYVFAYSNGWVRVYVILVTMMSDHIRNKVLEVCIEGVRTCQESELFQSLNLLCYTREWVKREQKEILQSTTTYLYIQCIYHHRTIPHASMYHLNIHPWSYTLPTPFLINKTMPHHPTLQHRRPLPYHNKVYCHHYTSISRLPTSPSICNTTSFQNLYLWTFPDITRQLHLDRYEHHIFHIACFWIHGGSAHTLSSIRYFSCSCRRFILLSISYYLNLWFNSL